MAKTPLISKLPIGKSFWGWLRPHIGFNLSGEGPWRRMRSWQFRWHDLFLKARPRKWAWLVEMEEFSKNLSWRIGIRKLYSGRPPPPCILRFSSRRQTARTFKVPGLYLASFKCTTILHISGRHAAVSFVPVNGIYSSYLFGRTRSSVLLCLFVA